MAWGLKEWKTNKQNFEIALRDGRVDEAKKIIDDMAVEKAGSGESFDSNFYQEFSDNSGTFAEHPIMACLFHGNKEVFDYAINKLSPNLSKAVNANHVLINVAVTPCKEQNGQVNEDKLRQAQEILNFLNIKLTPENKIKVGFFNLATFFMHVDLVSKLTRDPYFEEMANKPFARNAKPINFPIGLYNEDERNRRIYDVLISNVHIQKDIKNNASFVQSLFDGCLYGIFVDLFNRKIITDSKLQEEGALTAALGGLVRQHQVGRILSDEDIKSAEKILNQIIELGNERDVLRISHHITSLQDEIKEILARAVVKKYKSKLEKGEIDLFECGDLLAYFATRPDLLNGVMLTDRDRNLLVRNGAYNDLAGKEFSHSFLASDSSFVKQDLRLDILSVISKLTDPEKPKDMDALKNEYKNLIKEVLKYNQMTIGRFEEFRKSVEVALAASGRNERYQMVSDVHHDLYRKLKVIESDEIIPIEGINMNRMMRVVNVGAGLVGAVTSTATTALVTSANILWAAFGFSPDVSPKISPDVSPNSSPKARKKAELSDDDFQEIPKSPKR